MKTSNIQSRIILHKANSQNYILFLRMILTQPKEKFNKTPPVYILLTGKNDEFWQGERPGRDLYFICHLSFFRTSLFVTAALKFCSSEISMYGNEDQGQREARTEGSS